MYPFSAAELQSQAPLVESTSDLRTLTTSSKTPVFKTPGTNPAPIPYNMHGVVVVNMLQEQQSTCCWLQHNASSRRALCRLRGAGTAPRYRPSTWILWLPGFPPLSTGDSVGSTATTCIQDKTSIGLK